LLDTPEWRVEHELAYALLQRRNMCGSRRTQGRPILLL
jgi:hypothetical protein